MTRRESRKLARYYKRLESNEFESLEDVLQMAEYLLVSGQYGMTRWSFKEAAACMDAVDLRILREEVRLTEAQESRWESIRSHRDVRSELKVWPYPSKPGSTGGKVHWDD